MARMIRYPSVVSTASERIRYQRWCIEDSGLSRHEMRLIASLIWPEDAGRGFHGHSLVRAKSGG